MKVNTHTLSVVQNLKNMEIKNPFKLNVSDTSFFYLSQLAQTNFHFLRVVFSSQLKSKVGHILTKDVVLRIMLNIDESPIPSRSHTHPSHTQNSHLLTSSLS
jgi:hypothetical protein